MATPLLRADALELERSRAASRGGAGRAQGRKRRREGAYRAARRSLIVQAGEAGSERRPAGGGSGFSDPAACGRSRQPHHGEPAPEGRRGECVRINELGSLSLSLSLRTTEAAA